jgi:lysozyme
MSWLDICTPFVKAHEGCQLTAYQDIVGRWTIGYGATGPSIGEGLVWTQDQADADLANRLTIIGQDIDSVVTVPIADNQKAALGSFVYNLGLGALKGSTLLIMLNHGDYAGAGEQFARWNKAGGNVVEGLVTRRADEAALFAS